MRLKDYAAARRPRKGTAEETSDNTPAERQTPPVNRPTTPLGYFDPAKSCFWVKNGRDEWTQRTEANFKRILRFNVFPHITEKEWQMKEVDKYIMNSMHNDDVSFSQPIAGYQAGVHQISGQRILCPTGPMLIKPRDGRWTRFKRFVDVLLGEHSNVFHSWLKSALRALYAGPRFRPGQMLVLAGPPGCGKSLLQNIITELLGGRVAKPYRYMTDRTTFNSDLIGAEHLMIEDEAASRELKIRRHFGAQLKNMIAGEGQSLHRKGRDALMVTPFWRITLSVNDEPENLMVLPPLDESIEDKITLLRCFPAQFDYGSDDVKARNKFREDVTNELPHYLRWLQTFKIPDKMKSQRFGVAHFHDPVLTQALQDLQPESKLWNLIHNLQIWGIDNMNFVGSANDLEELLLQKDKLNRVSKLLYFDTSCGVYLHRLMKIYPDRVRFTEERSRHRKWEITHPDRSFSL